MIRDMKAMNLDNSKIQKLNLATLEKRKVWISENGRDLRPGEPVQSRMKR